MDQKSKRRSGRDRSKGSSLSSCDSKILILGKEKRTATLYARIRPSNKRFLALSWKHFGFASEAEFVDELISDCERSINARKSKKS